MILVVVIPTFNEAGNLGRLADALQHLDVPDVDLRLLIVDDGSTDQTAQIADDLAGRAPDRIDVLHRDRKRGLGSAYVDGFARALTQDAELVAQMDADLSHEPAVLQSMIRAIADADLVIGSRYVPGGGVDEHWPLHRKVLSWSANRLVVPALLSLPLTDATSGFRLWRRDALARIARAANAQSSGYGFQVEMAYLAHHTGCRIKEVPIYFRERESGQSKMKFWVTLGTVGEILSIRRKHGALPRLRTVG